MVETSVPRTLRSLGSRLRLRYGLAAAFTVIAIVPVLLFSLWVEHTAMRKELDAVHEKHLLLAQNLTAALELYAHDVETAFETLIAAARKGEPLDAWRGMAAEMSIRAFHLIDSRGGARRSDGFGDDGESALSEDVLARVRAAAEPDHLFTPVMADHAGRPTLFMVRDIEPGLSAIAALDTRYFTKLQGAIAFGRKGHAAIVDRKGTVLAHPREAWRLSMKSIAKVKPVAMMMAGQTGVTDFFSPATQMEMISGFTVVPSTGWGVMVPQPINELEERAGDAKTAAQLIALSGLLLAAILGWALSGLLTRPLAAVVAASRRIAGGERQARVGLGASAGFREFHDLADDFNRMADRIEDDDAAMARALHQAQMADTAKASFLANVGHEFRTPLNAIIGFADSMNQEILGPISNPRYREYLRDIAASGRDLLSVVNDILDLSTLEAGDMRLDADPVDLGAVVNEAVARHVLPAQADNKTLNLDLAPPLPPLMGNAPRLSQAIGKLVGNAIRFTPAGGRIDVIARQSGPETVEIIVADTGIGMSAAEIETALMPFSQVDGALNRRYEGIGLGLPLARRLIELHGGMLELRSEPGAGTVATIRLPVNRDRTGDNGRPTNRAAA